jgi:hypothetical protein
MLALQAGFPDEPEVPEQAGSSFCAQPRSVWTEIEVPANLDARDAGLDLVVVDCRAGNFTAPATHTSGRFLQDHHLSIGTVAGPALDCLRGTFLVDTAGKSQHHDTSPARPCNLEEFPSSRGFVHGGKQHVCRVFSAGFVSLFLYCFSPHFSFYSFTV